MEMEARCDSITNKLKGVDCFEVPVYQRRYAWNVDNITRLYADIVKLFQCKDKKHFIGSVVLKNIETENYDTKCVIIDGQQRLITLSIFLKSLWDVYNDTLTKNEIARIKALLYSGNETTLKVKLKLLGVDDVVWNKLLLAYKPDLLEEEKKNKVFENYDIIRNLILKDKVKGYTFDDYYKGITLLSIVCINLGGESQQEIFESLNSTGLGLEESDLLRNHLFMKLSYEQQNLMYKEYWVPIENIVHKENLEHFLQMYAMYILKTDNITQNNIFDKLKKKFDFLEDGNCVDSFKEVYTYAQYYAEYFNLDSDGLCAEEGTLDYYAHKLSCWYIYKTGVLLYFFLRDELNKPGLTVDEIHILNQGLYYVLNYIVRNILSTHSVPLSAQYIVALVRKLSAKDCDICDYEHIIKGYLLGLRRNHRYTDDNDLLKYAEDVKLYTRNTKNSRTLGLLLDIEQSYNKREKVKLEDIQLEHILPQNPRKEIKGTKSLLHVLGNLTLLSSGDNQSANNKEYSEKKIIYKNSRLHLNTKLSTMSNWGASEIRSRNTMLYKHIAEDMYPEMKEDNIDSLLESLDSDSLVIANRSNIVAFKYKNENLIDVKNMREVLLKTIEMAINEYEFELLEQGSSLSGNITLIQTYAKENYEKYETVDTLQGKVYINNAILNYMTICLQTLREFIESIGEDSSCVKFKLKG